MNRLDVNPEERRKELYNELLILQAWFSDEGIWADFKVREKMHLRLKRVERRLNRIYITSRGL